MSAIFKAPIAAIVFALEVIMLDLTMASIIPLLMASVTAALTSYFFLGQNVLYPFEVSSKFSLTYVPFYIILGVITSFVSVYFTRMIDFAGKQFDKIKSWITRFAIGASILGLLVFLFPALYGEGYSSINSALQGDYTYIFDRSLFYGFKGYFVATIILLLVISLLN